MSGAPQPPAGQHAHAGMRPDARLNQALALLESGRAADAVAMLRRLAASEKTGGMAHALLGSTLLSAGQGEQAAHFLTRAAAMAPTHPGVLAELTAAHLINARPKLAIEAARRALAITPDDPGIHTNLGVALANIHDTTGAELHLRRALALRPGAAAAGVSLAQVLAQSGRAREAADLLRTLPPDDPATSAMAAFVSNYDDRCTPPRRLELHRAMAAAMPLPTDAGPPLAPPRPIEGRRVRVAYLSPDLYDHPVASFVEPLLRHHDRARFDVTLYATHQRDDAVARRLRALGHAWVNASGLDDAALLARLRTDAPDILIDLAGNTATSKLGVLARRCAPLQVTAVGYPATTGTPHVDARLVDAITDPPAADVWHTERLLRVPGCFLCYQPHAEAAPVAPLPALAAGGRVTFGSFNNLAKLGDSVLSLWAAVLNRVPGSRLLLKAARLGDASVNAALISRLATAGIDPARVELVGFAPRAADHLATYARVDIALDTTPYAGTTTTCEALDHGVPVVTLAGEAHAARVGASLLSAAGLPRLIAPTSHEYVDIAATLAADLPALATLRATLRNQVRTSPLCDGPAYAARVEAALLESLHAHRAHSAPSSTP